MSKPLTNLAGVFNQEMEQGSGLSMVTCGDSTGGMLLVDGRKSDGHES